MGDLSTTTKRPPIATVREWTIALGILTAGQMTRADAEMKLAAYVPLLQAHFPIGAFTQDSLHHVAAQCKWFPSYAEVIEHLRAWWRDNRPSPPALPPPVPEAIRQHEPLTEVQLDQLHALTRATVAWLRSSAQPDTDRRPAGPRYLSPQQLDAINPLPDGRKRHHGPDAATVPPEAHDAAAPVDPDPARAA